MNGGVPRSSGCSQLSLQCLKTRVTHGEHCTEVGTGGVGAVYAIALGW